MRLIQAHIAELEKHIDKLDSIEKLLRAHEILRTEYHKCLTFKQDAQNLSARKLIERRLKVLGKIVTQENIDNHMEVSLESNS